jgi:hypothetical protein
MAEVSVSAQVEYIMFEAIRGGSNLQEPFGDIAIDDVELWTDCYGETGGGECKFPLTLTLLFLLLPFSFTLYLS